MADSKSSSSGISFVSLLGLTFIILKLTGVIAWSWWWVLAPFWVGAALAIVIILVVLLVGAVVAILDNK